MRDDHWQNTRLDWNECVRQLYYKGSFPNEYGMSFPPHGKHFHVLDPFLQWKEYHCYDKELIQVELNVAN